jgi:hypothetical protein
MDLDDLEKHPLRGVDSLRYRVYIEDEEEQDMEFKGYDYGELIDAFGIREEYQVHSENIVTVEGILESLPTFEADELDLKMIEDYIWDHMDDEEGILDARVKAHMTGYLATLRDEEHVSDSTMLAANALLQMAKDDEDDFGFVAWFCLMLPRLWT